MNEPTKEIRDGVEVLVYPSGAIKRADNGHWMRPPDSALLTPERARQLVEIKKQKGVMAQLRALAKGTGIELPEDAELEEIIEHAANGAEALTLHFYKQFMASKNLRGMAEAYTKLAAPLIGERSEPAQVAHTINNFHISDDAARFLMEVRERMKAQEQPQAIDTEASAWQQHAHGPEE